MVKTLLTSLAILAATPAFGQAAAPDDATVSLKLSRPMIQAIGNALMKAPYETSAPIMAELQRQLNEANAAAGIGVARDDKQDKPTPATPRTGTTPGKQ
jgi:hypothetical protein